MKISCQRVFPRRARNFVGRAAAVEAEGVTETGEFSISDEEIQQRGLVFRTDHEGVNLDTLNNLFQKVGFPKREKAKLRAALQHTPFLFWIAEEDTLNVVAFARATGDAVFNAIIWDVVVDPRYQGLGLGKAVMERLMASLVQNGICNIALYAEPSVINFYKPLGFIPDPDGIRGMAFRKRR